MEIKEKLFLFMESLLREEGMSNKDYAEKFDETLDQMGYTLDQLVVQIENGVFAGYPVEAQFILIEKSLKGEI